MLLIDPSHFAALSFFLFLGFLLYKRFFNVDSFIDTEIQKIAHDIEDAAKKRENAYIKLKEAGQNDKQLEIDIVAILERAHQTCDALSANFREEIAYEIDICQKDHQAAIFRINEKCNHEFHALLVRIIIEKLKNYIDTHQDETFSTHHVYQSLALLKTAQVSPTTGDL